MWDPKTVPINQFYASAFVLFELLSREVNSVNIYIISVNSTKNL